MKLSKVKEQLSNLTELRFQLPDSSCVPEHFHITEVGMITKQFIDCGGTMRNEKVVNFQLWKANDYEHRLAPQKLLNIIELSEQMLNIEDLEVEVEYQANTIGKYGLEFNGSYFLLTTKQTDCLAKDKCGIPPEKLKTSLSDLKEQEDTCVPGSGCC